MTIRRKVLWPVPLVLAAIFVGVDWIYWPLVLDSGVLLPEADSISIPMFEGLLISPLLALLMALWSLPALWGAPEQIEWFAQGQGVRALIGNVVYGGGALVGLVGALSLFGPSGELTDALWLVWLVPFVV